MRFAVIDDGRLLINEAYYLPNADGTADQVLTTDGSGNVTFENQTIGKSANSTQLIEITDGADIPSTLASNTTYLIRGTVTTSTEVTVSNEGSQIIGLDRSKDKIIFTGISGTTFLTINDVNFSMSDVWLSSTNANSHSPHVRYGERFKLRWASRRTPNLLGTSDTSPDSPSNPYGRPRESVSPF